MATIRLERIHPSLTPLRGSIFETEEGSKSTFNEPSSPLTPRFLSDTQPSIADRIDAFVRSNPTTLTIKEFYRALAIWEFLLDSKQELPKNIPQTFKITSSNDSGSLPSVTIVHGKHKNSLYVHITPSSAVEFPIIGTISVVNQTVEAIREAITRFVKDQSTATL